MASFRVVAGLALSTMPMKIEAADAGELRAELVQRLTDGSGEWNLSAFGEAELVLQVVEVVEAEELQRRVS